MEGEERRGGGRGKEEREGKEGRESGRWGGRRKGEGKGGEGGRGKEGRGRGGEKKEGSFPTPTLKGLLGRSPWSSRPGSIPPTGHRCLPPSLSLSGPKTSSCRLVNS